MKHILSIIALLSILLVVQCTKEEETVQYINAEQTEIRNGTFRNIFSLEEYTTYHQSNGTQEAFNKDSILNTTFEYKGEKLKALTLHNGIKIPVKYYLITFMFTDSTTKSLEAWRKDTLDNFIHVPTGRNNAVGNFKSIKYARSGSKMSYYDHKYNKVKNKFIYRVTGGTLIYSDYINGSTENGEIFFLNF